MKILKKTLTQIEAANRQRMEEKEKKLDSLLKTPKGLGIIENLAIIDLRKKWYSLWRLTMV